LEPLLALLVLIGFAQAKAEYHVSGNLKSSEEPPSDPFRATITPLQQPKERAHPEPKPVNTVTFSTAGAAAEDRRVYVDLFSLPIGHACSMQSDIGKRSVHSQLLYVFVSTLTSPNCRASLSA
jgi:hypothetical protein